MNIAEMIGLSLEDEFLQKFIIENNFEEEIIEIDENESNHYLCSETLGIEIIVTNNKIGSIKIFDGNSGKYSKFPYDLPLGLTFGDTKESVQTKINQEPTKSNSGGSFMLKKVNPWERYDLETFAIRSEYTDTGLSKINLMTYEHIEAQGL